MLFSYSINRYRVLKFSYLQNFKIGGGVFNSFKIDNNISPCISTAIDMSETNVYKKLHQEYLERFRIGLNNNNILKVKSLDILKKQINIHSREVLGFGFNEKYGVMDTTGTASGYNSDRIKKKALFELIEKNEAMLIWHLGKGYSVIQNDYINKLINKIGFFSDEIYIFASNNLCNYMTFVVLLFHNKKIIATGVSIERSTETALINALLEAKLLESIFRDSINSPYYSFTQEDYDVVYEKVLILNKTMNKFNIENNIDIDKKIVLSSWITSIEFAMLNIKPYEQYATIRCFSSDLLNSIPLNKNIAKSLDRTIFKVFDLDEKFFLNATECIII